MPAVCPWSGVDVSDSVHRGLDWSAGVSEEDPRHLALVGPTASGKSAIALEVATALRDVEIVVVDSMQVYRGMDIGTAKPSAEEQAQVCHHLLDLVDPGAPWSVTDWVDAARTAVAGIEGRGHRALLVGGTGLYFQALVDKLEPPGRYPEVIAALEGGGTPALYKRLQQLDPLAAARIQPGNRRRILRALEVSIGAGRPFSSFGPGLGAYPPARWRIVGLWLPRAVVSVRIRLRLAAMVDAGLLEEVRSLTRRPGGLGRTAAQALGYRELLAHLAGTATLEEAVAEAARRTVAFARRQRVWWRRDPRITWYGTAENPLAVLPELLRNWKQP
ncbi:MAG: tRNA (adenosine(37)-N6)-dimethylallyltransferase MiaA [Acidimicrobiaceae bacterium]|nr:tRNA (adenosine(37)-N6)-dimethylallyltransferase MiaA [Acidimicrobiaceae bacterium]